MQKMIGVVADGLIGPRTIEASWSLRVRLGYYRDCRHFAHFRHRWDQALCC